MDRRILFPAVLFFALISIAQANAACVSSSGSQVIRPVFSDGTSVMYCPDGDNWSTLLAAGAGVPAGSTGQIQFNNAGAFAGDTGLFWDNTNKRLGIGTASPLARFHVDGASRFNGNVDFTLAGASLNSWIGVSQNIWTTPHLHIGGYGDAPNRSIGLWSNTTFIQGNLGLGTTTPTQKLDIAAGGAIRVDKITHLCTPDVPVYDCACPSGYDVISGGGWGAGGITLRESRPTNLSTWRVACMSGTTDVACAGMLLICARILN